MDSPSEQTQCFETWEDFDKAVKNVELWRIDQNEKVDGGYCPELLFRGQANSGWELETTLERFSTSKEYLVDAYYEKIFKASQEILQFSKKRKIGNSPLLIRNQNY